jgi:HEAT repeat protein
MQKMAQQTTGKKDNMSQITSSNEPSDWSWVIKAAQTCENLWNQNGRASAKSFAEGSVSLPALRTALVEGNSLVRTKTLHIMSLLNPLLVLEDINSILRTDPCPVVRHEAAYFLGTMRNQEAVQSLGEALLHDNDELVRHEAAEAIGEIGLATGLEWLKKSYADSSELVRRTVEIAELHITLNQNGANDSD